MSDLRLSVKDLSGGSLEPFAERRVPEFERAFLARAVVGHAILPAPPQNADPFERRGARTTAWWDYPHCRKLLAGDLATRQAIQIGDFLPPPEIPRQLIDFLSFSVDNYNTTLGDKQRVTTLTERSGSPRWRKVLASKYDIADQQTLKEVNALVERLVRLRATFDQLVSVLKL